MFKIEAVLFDFDGVLIDSIEVMDFAWNSIKDKFKIENDFEEYKKYIGLPFLDILDKLGIEKKLHKEIKSNYSLITSKDKQKINLNPYALYLLNWLKKNSIKVGIVTSKDKLRTEELIDYFQLKIDVKVTPELTNRGKPDPEPIFLAVKNLKCELEKTIFVGDMYSDLLTAKRAKCHYLHYGQGYQHLENISYGGTISSLFEIKEYIYYFGKEMQI